MQLIDREILVERRRGVGVHLYAFGDIHVGSRHCDMDGFERDMEKIRADPKAAWIFMGDGPDCIVPTDKRFDPEEVHPAFRDVIGRLPQAQTEWLIERLEPIKDKGIAILEGNHERAVKTKFCYDPHYEMWRSLQVPSLSYCGFVRLKFRSPDGNSVDVVTVYAHHGYGGGRSPGGHALALDHALDAVEADLLLFGHRHQSMAMSKVRLGISTKGKLRLTEHHMKSCHTGTYLKTSEVGPAGYGERALYKPTALGLRKITISPYPKEIQVIV